VPIGRAAVLARGEPVSLGDNGPPPSR
jgi:hypothetical protein